MDAENDNPSTALGKVFCTQLGLLVILRGQVLRTLTRGLRLLYFSLVSPNLRIMSYCEFDTPWVEEPWESAETALRDADGIRLYETDGSGLLFKIIYLNDVPRLKQYLSVYSPPLDIEDKEFNDPLCVAASQGRTDILRVLVDYYETDSTKVPLHKRKYSLLTAAGKEAQLETAQFILDSQPAINSAYIDQSYRDEALLATARSLTALPPSDRKHETPSDSDHWISSRIARAEELMRLLLDGGASARAAEIPTTEVEWATMVLFGGSASQHDGNNSQPTVFWYVPRSGLLSSRLRVGEPTH